MKIDITAEKSSSDNLLSTAFSLLYLTFRNQNWPVLSSIDSTPKILDIAFPDKAIVYYVASFTKNEIVELSGNIPDSSLAYFWSLTIYDSSGAPVKVWNYLDQGFTGLTFYQYTSETGKILQRPLTIGPGKAFDYEPTTDVYCIVQRIYKKTDFTIYPNYVPTITLKPNTENLKEVTTRQRIFNSEVIQFLLWGAFDLKFSSKTPQELYPNINNYEFFLPSINQTNLAFPNSSAKYLVTFPESSNVIRVKGKIPQNVGYKENVIFISYMAGNQNLTSTDNSISFTDLKTDEDGNYILYAAYSKEEAALYGYDPSKYNLVTWDKLTNTFPMLIFRVVSSITNSSEPSTVVQENPILAPFLYQNEDNCISGNTLYEGGENNIPGMGEYYPIATTFTKKEPTESWNFIEDAKNNVVYQSWNEVYGQIDFENQSDENFVDLVTLQSETVIIDQ